MVESFEKKECSYCKYRGHVFNQCPMREAIYQKARADDSVLAHHMSVVASVKKSMQESFGDMVDRFVKRGMI